MTTEDAGDLMKNVMEASGKTVHGLAAELGVSPDTVCRWRAGDGISKSVLAYLTGIELCGFDVLVRRAKHGSDEPQETEMAA